MDIAADISHFPGRHASVGTWNGAPALFIDGKLQNFTSYKIAESVLTEKVLETIPEELPPILRSGIRICWIPVFIDWQGPGKYDFSDMDRRINAFVKTAEQIINTEDFAIAIRIQAASFSPVWYIESKRRDGQYTNLIRFRNVWGEAEPVAATPEMRCFTGNIKGFGSTFGISPADEFWDTHAQDCLRAVIDHAKGQPYHKYVFAYLPCAFNSNEWFIHTKSPLACCDFSEPAQRGFAKWLQERGMECGENPVPAPELCHPVPGVTLVGTYGAPRPVKDHALIAPDNPDERRIEEFSLYYNDRVSGIIADFARIIKEQYRDCPKLVGFFYGYTVELSHLQHLAQSGHLGLRKILNCKDIDFLCSPSLYSARQETAPVCFTMPLGAYADSMQLCGKLVYVEDDHHPAEFASSGECRDEWHDRQAFLRNFGMAAAHGFYEWWYSLGCGWLVPEHRRQTVGELHSIANELLKRDRSPVAEVAVLVDERSVSAMNLNPGLNGSLIRGTIGELARCGVPFEVHELHTFLQQADFKRYRFILFANLIAPDETEFARINELKDDNRILYFQYNAGLRRGNNLSAEAASALTGIKLSQAERQALTVWFDPDRNALGGISSDFRFGPGDRHQPLLECADSEATALGYLPEGGVGFAERKHDSWTAVWCAAPALPAPLLRALMESAGVRMYTDPGHAVYANSSFVAVTSSIRGKVQFTIPGCSRLTNLCTGEELPPNAEIVMRRHETVLLLKG